MSKGKKSKKGGVKFLLIVLCFAVLGILGKMKFDEYRQNAKANDYIRECMIFIEARKFTRAEESIDSIIVVDSERTEIADLQGALKEAREVDSLEKTIVVHLERRDWDQAESVLEQLQKYRANHPFLKEKAEEVREGRLAAKLKINEKKLKSAQRNNDLKEMIRYSDILLALDPENRDAASWDSLKLESEEALLTRDSEAEKLYKRAFLLNSGRYNEEVIALAKKASQLSKKKEYHDFAKQVSLYPRTITYPKDYSTIQEAIDASREIDEIYFEPGEYEEVLVVNKKLKLVGADNGTVTIFCSPEAGSPLYVTKNGDLDATRIQFKHTTKGTTETAYSAVVIAGSARMSSCVFYQSAGHGAFVTESGKAEFVACRAEENSWDGFAVRGSQAVAQMRSCISINNGHHGYDVWDGGNATIELSNSEQNNRSGIVCQSEGMIKLVDSRVSENNEAGIYLVNAREVMIRKSDITKNKLGGIYADMPEREFVLRGVQVTKNQAAGVVLTPKTLFAKGSNNLIQSNAGQQIWRDATFAAKPVQKAELVEKVTELDQTIQKAEVVEPLDTTPQQAIIIPEE